MRKLIQDSKKKRSFRKKFSVVDTLNKLKVDEEILISNKDSKANNIRVIASTHEELADKTFKISEKGLDFETRVIRTA